jgi:DMSO/TMAO reductase YedYZ heme-binding membrane subunit
MLPLPQQRESDRAFSGWAIVGWAAAAILVMEGSILTVLGAGEGGLRATIRASARTSAILFSAAFAASSLHALWPGPPTAWLLANRRYLGVSFAFSHFTHLAAILTLVDVLPPGESRISPLTAIAGGIGYLFVAAMTATSFDATAAWLGPRRWSALHKTGGYFVLIVFLLTFLPVQPPYAVHALFFLLLLATLGLRIAARGPTSRALPRRTGPA